MKAPQFWKGPPGRFSVLSLFLAPLALVYAVATRRRVAKSANLNAKIPVICIGNLNAGGTGKTPTVIALAQKIENGVHIVTRGYGGKLEGPIRVDPKQMSAGDTGDEPLLLSAFAPTWVAKDRVAGVKAAQEAGAKCILLDDGFQDPSVAKDLSIVVVDAAYGFGNGRVIPSGPLRETVAEGLKRADLVLSIGGDPQQAIFEQRWGNHLTCPHITGKLKPLQTGMEWQDADVVAFAGIGIPEKFFATLRGLGAKIVQAQALNDHQPLTVPLMKRLQTEARLRGAQLVTTEKDHVRLPPDFCKEVVSLPVRLVFGNPDTLDAALAQCGLLEF